MAGQRVSRDPHLLPQIVCDAIPTQKLSLYSVSVVSNGTHWCTRSITIPTLSFPRKNDLCIEKWRAVIKSHRIGYFPNSLLVAPTLQEKT